MKLAALVTYCRKTTIPQKAAKIFEKVVYARLAVLSDLDIIAI